MLFEARHANPQPADGTSEPREQIVALEIRIEELSETIERCRKIRVISRAAIAAGALLLLAVTVGAVRFDPT